MTFQPVIPLAGLAGWNFLQRTMDKQLESYAASPAIQRDTDYFVAKIGVIDTAEQLMKDRRLLRVALGAFGLQDDIDNRYFIQKILEEGTLDEGALANKLSDDRYRKFSAAFGFGDYPVPSTKISDFGTRIVDKFRRQSFEVAVGDQDNAMRLAMNAERELAELAQGTSGDKVKWLRVLGNSPLREVFETALGLPRQFGQLDLDRQVDVLRERMGKLTGESGIDQFADPDKRRALVRRYLLRDQVGDITGTSSGTVAVGLLQSVVEFGLSLRRV